MVVLRGPDGCPWDREQDHRTLRAHLLEETYEVLSLLDADPLDDEELVEELGDLLLQVVFHAQLAAEEDRFDLNRIATAICNKLIRRHPHVFGDVEVNDASDVLRNWESLKREEGRESVLQGVPPALPALLRASRVLAKAERAGVQWSSLDGARGKVSEEWAELQEAEADPGGAHHELGDLLLALITYAHHLDMEPESVLREALQRFDARFRAMEGRLRSAGKRLDEMEREELVSLWNEAADSEGQPPATSSPGFGETAPSGDEPA